MTFDEMVMIIVNDKGHETNILTTFEDFTQEFLYLFVSDIEDIIMMIKELSEKQGKEGWTECYKTANKTVGAKYCSGAKELVSFMNGKFNDREVGLILTVSVMTTLPCWKNAELARMGR